MSLIADVVSQVSQDAAERGLARVHSVRLTVGRFSHVRKNSLEFGFNLAKQGTLLHDATLDIIETEEFEPDLVEYEGTAD